MDQDQPCPTCGLPQVTPHADKDTCIRYLRRRIDTLEESIPVIELASELASAYESGDERKVEGLVKSLSEAMGLFYIRMMLS